MSNAGYRSWLRGPVPAAVILLGTLILCAGDAAASEPVPAINAGHGGHWFDTDNPGQGFIIEVLADRGKVAVGWFSFAKGAPAEATHRGQRWFTGLGSYSGDTAELVVYDTNGGVFAQPGDVVTEPLGSATFRVESCLEAVLEFQLVDGNSGVISLNRLTAPLLCRMLEGQARFPLFAWFRAEASAEFDDGYTVECQLEFLMEVELLSDDGFRRRYVGALGGEARRRVLDDTGAGVSFAADAYIPGEIQLTGDRVEIQGTYARPDQVPRDEDSRFWNELDGFQGDLASDGTASGPWRCAPLDTRGDDSRFAPGRWWLEPATDEDRPPQR